MSIIGDLTRELHEAVAPPAAQCMQAMEAAARGRCRTLERGGSTRRGGPGAEP